MKLHTQYDINKGNGERKCEHLIYFTSDLHFYHENIIRHTNRPFRSTEEMNMALIHNWNQRVSYQDEVYILGDFTMKGPELAAEALSQLKGIKHLIRGNHDRFLDNAAFDRSLFASVRDYAEIKACNTKFILFHYPIVEWNGFFKGTISLHGHQHNHAGYNEQNRRNSVLRYDVGVDANNMNPVSAEEIIAFFYANT